METKRMVASYASCNHREYNSVLSLSPPSILTSPIFWRIY